MNFRTLYTHLFLTPAFFISSFCYATDVVIETPLGNIPVELFDNETPVTVENFLTYINDGDYNSSFIHRSFPGFVIQGGGFTFINDIADSVPADPPIQNEFNRSNTRGTIAMARIGGQANSATSQWFINLDDNTDLDSVDGGFTVFGQVTGDGMDVADAIASLQIVNAGGAFAELPVIDFSGNGNIEAIHLVFTAVDLDNDSDGIGNSSDNCPEMENSDQADNDDDEAGDLCDDDDDNDQLPDEYEITFNFDPFDASDAALDRDNDGKTNLEEFLAGTNPGLNEAVILLILNNAED